MRHFTARITRTPDASVFEAVAMDFPLPVVRGRSLAEVQDNLLTAMQRHIDLMSELAGEAEAGVAPVREAASSVKAPVPSALRPSRGGSLLLEIPEYLVTRN